MLNKLIEHYDTSVFVKRPEDYICCIGCKGKRVKRVDLYSRINEEIRNCRPGFTATVGVVNHMLYASWITEPCKECNGIGYWKHNQ